MIPEDSAADFMFFAMGQLHSRNGIIELTHTWSYSSSLHIAPTQGPSGLPLLAPTGVSNFFTECRKMRVYESMIQ